MFPKRARDAVTSEVTAAADGDAPELTRPLTTMKRATRFNLFVAFSFTVMADPVSSVAYAMEAALGELDGDLSHLVVTMALVVVTIAVVAAGYHQLIARFPNGGGGPEGLAAAFGEGWAFLPIGALLVDFTLTIAVSCAAGAAALIAYVPSLDPYRIPLALGLAIVVGVATLLGHRARIVFATATLVFVALTLVLIVRGALRPSVATAPAIVGDAAVVPILLAMPLGMALATGVEAPSNAVAQLGQLDARGKRLFGQLTLWLMLGIVGALTLSLAVLAVRFGVGHPASDSTFLADIADHATGRDGLFAAFQLASLALLLAAAASSYLAGSGLLKALAQHGGDGGLLSPTLGRVNRFYAPPAGIALLVLTSTALIALARGRDQAIVQYYAVAVFASFLGAMVAGAVLAHRDRRRAAFALDVLGVGLVGLILALNMRRIGPLISLMAAIAISFVLYRAWVRRGRPAGVTGLTAERLPTETPPSAVAPLV